MESRIGAARAARPRLALHPSQALPLVITRLLEGEVHELRPWLDPIERDYSHEMLLHMSPRHCMLPSAFLAAEDLFGRSSQWFDPYKCSFEFPLFLSATRDGRPLRYVVLLGDFRGSITVPFYRLSHERRARGFAPYHPPRDEELSRADINAITEFFIGYLVGYGEVLARYAPSFHRVVESEHLIYGNRAGDLFEKSLVDHDWDGFRRAVDAIAADLAEEEARQERDRLERLVGCIERGEHAWDSSTLQFPRTVPARP
jgi:hypothetical protein